MKTVTNILKTSLIMCFLLASTVSMAQIDPETDCPAPENFLVGDYQIVDVSANVGPGNGTSNFAPGLVTIIGSGNTRTFLNAILPAFTNNALRTINLRLNCNVIQIEDVDANLSCDQVNNYIYTTTDVANSTPYSLTGSDASFVINYIEDPLGSCGGPFNSSFSLTKQCSRPLNISFSNATATTVDLNWLDTNNTSTTANTYSIEYGPQGFTPGSGQTVTGITGNSATINNLTTNTAYDFYVFGSCSDGSTSALAGPFEYANFANPDFIVGNNGVTCQCPDADFGDMGTLTINGETKTFTKRTETELRDLVAADINDPQIALTCTSGINNMSILFQDTPFNQNLENWDTSSVTNMNSMFSQAFLFNQPLNSWDVGQVTDMGRMLGSASVFNQPLDNWDVSNVTDMSFMFIFSRVFDQPLNNWDVGSVTNMAQMLPGTAFNQPLDSWDVSQVINMNALFALTPFNQPINNWDVSNVANMSIMFRGPFNQSLDNWDVSSVTNMNAMFLDTPSFNQDLSNWSFNEEVSLFSFLNNAGLDINNYDALLQSLDNQNLVGLTLGAESIVYCDEATRNNLITTKGWTITGDFLGQCGATLNPSTTPFVTTWTVLNNESIDIYASNGFDYDFTVDWGDGETDENVTADITHTYATAGTYAVSITGVFPYFKTCETATGFANCPNSAKLSNVISWGNQEWRVMLGSFNGATNFSINTAETPDLSNVTSMIDTFRGTTSFNSDISNWDVSQVTDMTNTFRSSSYNQSLNSWDVSGVTNMSLMFFATTAFDQSLSNWDVSSVTSMRAMFSDTQFFNQPLDNWDVSQVTDMAFLFNATESFNQSLNSWDVSQVTDMDATFQNAVSFNQPLDNWDVSQVTIMRQMFSGAGFFNQPLNNWDVGNVINMFGMFNSAVSFNQPLNNWDVGNVTFMSNMFLGAASFNEPLDNWDVSQVTSMNSMFSDATSFNQDISGWCVAQIPEEPTDFALNAALQTSFLPNWGAVCAPLSVNEENFASLNIYPNPTKNWLNIKSDALMAAKLSIYDINGRLVITQNLEGNLNALNVEQLQSGTYILKIEDRNKVQIQRFIKQ